MSSGKQRLLLESHSLLKFTHIKHCKAITTEEENVTKICLISSQNVWLHLKKHNHLTNDLISSISHLILRNLEQIFTCFTGRFFFFFLRITKTTVYSLFFLNFFLNWPFLQWSSVKPVIMSSVVDKLQVWYVDLIHTSSRPLVAVMKAVIKTGGPLKAWKGAGGREEEEGVVGVSQEKFNKTISHGGRGPRQSAGEALQLISVLDPVPSPVLWLFPQIFEVWFAATMQRPLKLRAEQTETGWVQCLSKVLIKPHSKVPLKPNKQELFKGTQLGNALQPRSAVVHFLIITWKYVCQQASTSVQRVTEHCKAICVKIWI